MKSDKYAGLLKKIYAKAFSFVTDGGFLSFLVSLGVIVALTWPWVLHFNGEFLSHWDPPFHAWKLEFMAGRILAGDPFFLSSNTNVLYPQSGTLYFEALQWPPAFFAALLFAVTDMPSSVVYHLTLLFFWALSAPCMTAFLKELGSGKAMAVCGGVLFCILPWRISYAVEFQMELVFAIPLFYLFLYRFFRNPGVPTGIFLAGAWWLQAVCELYQAVFIAMTVPLIAVSFIACNFRILKNRKFWISSLCAAVAGIAFIGIMLFPYLTLRDAGAVKRDLHEVIRHSAQVFSYLCPAGKFAFWKMGARTDELDLYPTLAVLLGTFAAFCVWLRGLICQRKKLQITAVTAGAVLFGTFIIMSGVLHSGVHHDNSVCEYLWGRLPLLCVAAGAAICFIPDSKCSPAISFMRGLGGSALLCFCLSLGPEIETGLSKFTDTGSALTVANTLYVRSYDSWLPFLSGFRIASRFGVVVLFFMLTAAVTVLGGKIMPLGAKYRKLHIAVAVAMIVLVAFESVPADWGCKKYRPVDDVSDSRVINILEKRSDPFVLAMLPMGNRDAEGMRMFSLVRDRFLSVYAWGGYFPKFFYDMKTAAEGLRAEETHAMLSRIWPDCLLLVDKSWRYEVDAAKCSLYKEFIYEDELGVNIDIVRAFSSVAEKTDEDGRFALMRLLPLPPETNPVKMFRTDVAVEKPVVYAMISAAEQTKITVSLNGAPVLTADAEAGIPLEVKFNLDPNLLTKTSYNELGFLSSSGKISISSFRLSER